MGTQLNASGIVLAGGRSRRLGRAKALEPFQGEPLIRRVIDRLSRITDDLVFVVNDHEQASALPISSRDTDLTYEIVIDKYPDGGSLGGIYTGLLAANSQWAFVVACDMPFLNVELMRHMLSMRDGQDVVVPRTDGYPEPTHALYNKSCLPFIEKRLKRDDLKIARFFDEIRVRFLEEAEVRGLDGDLLSFFNVNTQDDLDRALTLAAEGR
ncbi:MAG: molybdenum cofactor guanylyltransferase [Chloroflexi bacterium]|nr:molybdenum cofactor guanylyltransferase [Chloroflexota bacterium]MCI0791206.1 molybdenum cofactor guanylyltransferase [Chloroflexota bacterium]